MAGPSRSIASWPELAEVHAPHSWRRLEFLSDVHLHAQEPATAQAWLHHLAHTQADALFLLGDVFEVWVGDDLLGQDAFVDDCVQALQRLSQRCALFFMHGNRDFLAGPGLMQATGARPLADPTVLVLDGHRVLLSHGDALCLDDAEYLAFRAQVRTPAWQQAFVNRPLPERLALARDLRDQSQKQQAQRAAQGRGYADVDDAAALSALQHAQAQVLIHGHTHRPGRHALSDSLAREVLSDWDLSASPPRAQVLRLEREPGSTALRLDRIDLA